MEIAPGIYTIQDILSRCDLVVDDSYDRRRIKVGGLGFDDTAETFRVPATASELVVTLDGAEHATFTVK